MKLGLTSLTFRNNSIPDVFEYASKAGIEGIEWGIGEKHMNILSKDKAKQINELSLQYGIDVFSLGSYCDMRDASCFDDLIQTAVMIKAPIIRVWAGDSASDKSSDDNFRRIVENTIILSDMAKKYGIAVGFEYHNGTLTDTAQSAVRLIKSIDKDNVGLYWQPASMLSAEENLNNFNMVKPYLIGNLHVHNYAKESGYMPLDDIKDSLEAYYTDIKDKPYNVMIEFTKDSSLESLIRDAETLKRIIK